MNEATYREIERRFWDGVGLDPSEHRVRLKESGVAVRVQEVGHGPPVLFIHGASNSGTSWANLVVHLDDFRCLLLDRPGAGLSERPREPFADADALAGFSDELVVDVLDALDVSTASLVATSYGGYAALRGAAAHPDRINRVVILGWTMGAANPKMPLLMRLGGIPAVARLMSRMPVNESAVRSMLKRIGLRQAVANGKVSDDLVTCYTALLRHTDTMKNELEIGRLLMSWKGLNPEIVLSEELLAKVQAPVYFLWGEGDPFGSAAVAEAFASKVPNAELEMMPDAGHAVWIDDPRHVARVVRDHLGGPRAGS